MAKNYITPQGAEKLRQELRALIDVERPKLLVVIAWAASNGDRSENGDYIYGKRRLREIDRRVRFLSKRLDDAEIVDPTQQSCDRVSFGMFVKVLKDDGQERTFRIVGEDEIDLTQGWISWVSPVGRALLSARVGDLVTLRTIQPHQEFEILAISTDGKS